MIREAIDGDIQSIVKLGNEMMLEGRYSHIGYNFDKAQEFIERYIDSPSKLLLVSEIEGRICGFFFGFITDFYFADALMASEELWYMATEYRGRRDGIVMINKFVTWAKAFGVLEISASVSLGVENESAGRVLEAVGFDRVGENYKMRVL